MDIKLKIGSNILEKDGQVIEMDVAPFTQNDRTFVPIRFIAENLGYTVGWDEATQTVTITDKKPSKHKKYFDNPDDCAVDFAMCYQPLSIATNIEFSAVITKDKNGYYYTNVYRGVTDRCTIQKKGIEHISDIHTHGSAGGYKAYDEFSNDDKKSAKRNKVEYCYFASPFGNVQKYWTTDEKIEVVSIDTPYDVKEYVKISKKYPDVAKNIEYFKEYFGNSIPEIDAEDNKYTTAYLSWCNEADKYIKEFWNAKV